MDIILKKIKVSELVKDYSDNDENGVFGYGGLLNIRPPYQREFVYKDKQRDAVIDTVLKGFPLNSMYWAANEGSFEVLDGQQRTLSICKYINNEFSIDFKYFHNLTDDIKQKILDYELLIYICNGSESEKLDWFRIINIAGEKLTDQELLNAVFTGAWLTDAKKFFSKTDCPAYALGSDYISGVPIRQEYLEKALNWISNGHIEEYMAKNQHEKNASELILYYKSVINWVSFNFKVKRREMKSIDWGIVYNEHKNDKLDPDELEDRIALLMQDDEITKKSGIYQYVLTGEERFLNLRAFTLKDKREIYEKQKGICPITNRKCEFDEMDADHIVPWSKGGKTIKDNLQMIYRKANQYKSNK